MEARQAKTKSGNVVFLPVVDEEELSELSEGGAGFCIACGAEAGCCEPDARGYTCESCGQPKVYGLEELMMMGYVRVRKEE